MSKRAEEKALEIFPVKKVPYYGLSCNAYSERDANLDNRTLFCMGYEQAEKDLALTWEDVAQIITIYEAGIDNGDYRRYNDAKWMKEYSQDILRKFNENRKK